MATVARIGWIVDVQNDFMLPPQQGGRLYVRNPADPADPGAQTIIPAIVAAVQWMRANCAVLVFTGDWHSDHDAEISLHPDYRSTYPPHCMGLSANAHERMGAAVISEIAPEHPLVLPRDADSLLAEATAKSAVAQHRPIFLQKCQFDAFTGNSGTAPLLDELQRLLGSLEIVVIGVARDVCVAKAVDGMQERGYAVTVIPEATWGLGLEAAEDAYHRWAAQGKVVSLRELTNGQPA